MKISINIEVDSTDEAHEVIARLRETTNGWIELKKVRGITQAERAIAAEESGRETGANTDSGKKADTDEMRQSSHPATRPNVSPGEPSIVKIGTKSHDEIINDLKHSDRDPSEYAKGKLTEHLKLLWKRGEVKFDGEKYYL